MSTFSDFFAENIEQTPNIKYVASKRIKNSATGEPHEWEIRKLYQDENDALIKACTKSIKQRDGSVIKEVDRQKYMKELIAASVVFPNLKDAALQDHYHVVGATELLSKLLSIGEYARLGDVILKHNDLDDDINELIDEAKN